MEVWSNNFFSYRLNVSLDVQYNKVIAQAVGDGLFEDVCGVQSSLVGAGDVVVDVNWEGNTDCAQLFHCLFLVLFKFFFVQSDWGLAVFHWQAHFFTNQLGVVGAVGSEAQALHGVEVVLDNHWGQSVCSLPVVNHVEAIVECSSEGGVCNCLVPVFIRSAVFFVLVEVPVPLIGVLGFNVRYQIIVPLVVLFVDFVQTSFAQRSVVNFFVLPVLPGQVTGFYHLEGNGVEQVAILIPIHWVLGVDFLVALSVGGHGVWTIVPHILVVHRFNICRAAQLVDHALCHWVQTAVGCYRWEVWHWSGTGVNNGVFVRSFHLNHFAEFGAFPSGQSHCLIFAQGLGPLVVFICTFDHFQRHRGVGRVVLIEVQYPLQTGCKVFRGGSCFFVAVYVNPFYIVAQVEGPSFTAVLAVPSLCDTWNQFTGRVRFQQAVYQVTKVFTIFCSLGVQNVEGLQLTGCCFGDNEVFDLVFFIALALSFLLVIFLFIFLFIFFIRGGLR